MAREDRVKIIQEIEKARGSRVITYICSDRPGLGANIAEDAVWPMYDCLRATTAGKKIELVDLFLYSREGSVEIPWRIISMLREYSERVAFLVPYKAHSAATMIALGCDEIVAGKKAELGPIDPALNIRDGGDGTAAQMEIRVEDVMSYVNFLREKAELTDQSALGQNIMALGNQITPTILGSIYRTHSHIRQVAEKLLKSHSEPLEKAQIKRIIEELAEKIYLHGHAVSRTEAASVGLPVVEPNDEIEALMWQLMEEYSDTLLLRSPVDADTVLGDEDEQTLADQVLAITESEPMTWAFTADLAFKRVREAPPAVNINIKFGIQLPDGLDQNEIPQELANQINQKLNDEVPRLVQEQVKGQSPVLKVQQSLKSASWKDVTAAGI